MWPKRKKMQNDITCAGQMLESKCTYPPTYNSSSPDNFEGSVFILRFCLRFFTFCICSRNRLFSKPGEPATDVDVDVATSTKQALCNFEVANQTSPDLRLCPATYLQKGEGSVSSWNQVMNYYRYAVSIKGLSSSSSLHLENSKLFFHSFTPPYRLNTGSGSTEPSLA